MATALTSSRTRTDYVPENFSDLFAHYYPYVQRLVRKAGIVEEEIEDVAMTIMAKFFEKDALSDFSPDHVTEHGGVQRHTAFGTFLSGFVFAYVRHYRDRQQVRLRREPVICDSPVSSSDAPSRTWGEANAPVVVENPEERMDAATVLRLVREHLATVETTKRARVDMVEVFDAMAVQCLTLGDVSVSALAEEFGISAWAMRKWVARVRVEALHVQEN